MANTYQDAMEAALQEIANLQRPIETLLARRATLQALVDQLVKVIKPANSDTTISLFGSEDSEEPEYLWQQIATAMRGLPAWTFAEAGVLTEKLVQKTLEPNQPQKIRNSVVRHPETFERLSDGRYVVKPFQGPTRILDLTNL